MTSKRYFPTNSWIKPNSYCVSNVDMLALALSDYFDYVTNLKKPTDQTSALLKSIVHIAEFINANTDKYKFCVVGGKYHAVYTPTTTEPDGTPLLKRTTLSVSQEIRRGQYACNWRICQGDVTDGDDTGTIAKTVARRKAYQRVNLTHNGLPMSPRITRLPTIVSKLDKVNESPTRCSTGQRNNDPVKTTGNTFRRLSSLATGIDESDSLCEVRNTLTTTTQQPSIAAIHHDFKNRYG